jgi:hypothetical protein
MVINARAHLDFLDLNDLLLLARLGSLFLGLVFQTPQINDLANWRLGVGNNLDQIKPGFLGHRQGIVRGHNAHILAFGINQLDFGYANIAVGAGSVFLDGRRCAEGTANERELLKFFGARNVR